MSPKKLSYTIRDYLPGDFPHLVNLWKETGLWGEIRGDHPEVIDRCNTMGGKLLIMTTVDGKTLIGSSWMTYDGRRIYLHHFCIKPTFQRKGLGKILAGESMRFIRHRGAQVKLEVHKDNFVAKKLYEDLGFFRFADFDIYMIRDTK